MVPRSDCSHEQSDQGLHYSPKRLIYVSWSTSELRVRLAPLNRFKPSSKIFYWPFQGGTSFVDLLCFCSVLCLLCFVRVCLYVLCGHLLGKGWPLGSRLWCLLWVCHFPIGILGQVWYLIVSIPDLCTLTYFKKTFLQMTKALRVNDQCEFSVYNQPSWFLWNKSGFAWLKQLINSLTNYKKNDFSSLADEIVELFNNAQIWVLKLPPLQWPKSSTIYSHFWFQDFLVYVLDP